MTATATSKQTLTLPSEREIVITRWFNAPQALLWRAQTDPNLIPLWWGPRYLTTTVDKMDFRVGGSYRYIQLAPDGSTHAFRGEYKEIVPMDKLVSTFEYEPLAGHIALETATLEPRDGGTLLTMHALYANQEDRDGIIASGMESGQAESWERMDELAAALDAEFSYTREFGAPLPTVWRAFTDANQLAQWWGPKGLTMEHADLDFRPGGRYHYGMRQPNGDLMWGKFEFVAIEPEQKIVLVNSFSDAEGGVTRHPLMQGWPAETFNIWQFEALGDKTRLAMRAFPYNAAPAEIALFAANKASMQGGNAGTFAQLDAFLAQA